MCNNHLRTEIFSFTSYVTLVTSTQRNVTSPSIYQVGSTKPLKVKSFPNSKSQSKSVPEPNFLEKVSLVTKPDVLVFWGGEPLYDRTKGPIAERLLGTYVFSSAHFFSVRP